MARTALRVYAAEQAPPLADDAELVAAANLRALWALLWFVLVYHCGLGKAIAARLPLAPERWSPGVVSGMAPVMVLWGLVCSGIALHDGPVGAEENLAVAARALPDAPEIASLVADGTTLESALKKLKWESSDLLVVGSSRFAAPRRVFLGSTAARILAGTDAPVVVIPRGGD